jgi:hypothetical protein
VSDIGGGDRRTPSRRKPLDGTAALLLDPAPFQLGEEAREAGFVRLELVEPGARLALLRLDLLQGALMYDLDLP